ncbi:4-hydroxybenzoate octaprenyltransferase [Nitrospira sp. Kam-Ns4a]
MSDRPRGAPWTLWAQLLRLPNQSGTLLLMLPTFWALVLASGGRPAPRLLAIFAAGAFLMRSAGVVLNDLADRSLDRQVARTKDRPLASGALSARAAVMAACVLVSLAAGLLPLLNPLSRWLSPGAFVLAALYPLAKRIVHLPQAVLGVAFGWGVLMAWAEVRNGLALPVWLLYAATILWAVAYDTIYALQDREDDRRIGVKSAALLFGERTWLAVGVSLAGMLLLLGLTGWLLGLGPAFYGALVGIGGFLSQQVRQLRRDVPPTLAFAMFKQHVWVGWGILGGIWLGFL